MKNSFTLLLLIIIISNSYGQLTGGSELYKNASTYEKKTITNAYIPNDSTIDLKINILMNTLPDSYVAVLAVHQNSATLIEGNELINNRINGFINELSELNIDKKTVFVDIINQTPKYEFDIEKKLFSKTNIELPAGYIIQKNISIPFNNPEIMEKLMITAAKYTIYNCVDVKTIVKDVHLKYDTLRKEALKLLKSKLDLYKSYGFNLDFHHGVFNESITTINPSEQYSEYTGYESQVKSYSQKRQTSFSNKDKTYFFDGVEYAPFEMILNPEITEPPVQIMFQLRAYYIQKRKIAGQ